MNNLLSSPHSPPPGWDSWEKVMALALDQARQAGLNDEVPIGAVVLDRDGRVLAAAHNSPLSLNDPTAHAEILALRQAAAKTRNYRLCGCVLAVTLEPCLMCLGAMVHARIDGLVFGAPDPKSGAVISRLPGPELDFLNHRFWVEPSILANECGSVLSEFFREKRIRKSSGEAAD